MGHDEAERDLTPTQRNEARLHREACGAAISHPDPTEYDPPAKMPLFPYLPSDVASEL